MTENTQTLSLGQQFKTAREALGLSLVEVAQQTNLKRNHLESLEDDVFILPNIPPAFVRGYVRNYLRFLRLPVELIDSVNYGEVTLPKETKKVAVSVPVKMNYKSQARWVKGLTWLILLCAVGMTLAWWWQEHKKDQASSEQLVNRSVEMTQNNESNVVIPVSITTEPMPVNLEAQTVLQQSQTPAASEIPLATEATPPTVVVNVLQQPVAVEQVITEPTKQAESTVINDELRIEITNANSWITVRDAKNKKLAEKLYNVGEVLTFNGNEQYRLTVGAPANVKIYYKGEQVPLKVDGRVARFKLPLAN
ncbi:DNA-binding protein [Pasteurellaceae bacterium Orientalotternb1]|nr:DNA-binding protein [Pasteurellaceae bacterium Orientalotternb1]